MNIEKKTHRYKKLFFNITESLRSLFLNNHEFNLCTILIKIDYINYYISENITIGFYCPLDPTKIIDNLELVIDFIYNDEGILCTTQEVHNMEYNEKKYHYNYDSLISEIKNILNKINAFYFESDVCNIMDNLYIDEV